MSWSRSCTAPPRTCSWSRADGDREVLVPFVSALVPEVDLAGGRIVVDDLPGLFSGRRRADVRIDVVTIFPDYLAPLALSLPGKARERGLLDLQSTTCGRGPTTGTGPSTTRRTAAAPAW